MKAALGRPRELSPVSPTAATSPAPYPTNLHFGTKGTLRDGPTLRVWADVMGART